MEILISIIFIILVIYRTYILLLQYKRFKLNKQYSNIAKEVINDKKQVLKDLVNFRNNIKSAEYKTKAMILENFIELFENNQIVHKKLELENLYLTKNRFKKNQFFQNEDSLLWLFYSIIIAKNNSNKDVVEYYSDLLKENEANLNGYLYYELLKTFINDDYSVMLKLVKGENLNKYQYSKYLYLLFKNVCLTYLKFINKEETINNMKLNDEFKKSISAKLLNEILTKKEGI